MQGKQVNSAPVDHVGGTQERGPWPVDVDQIEAGKTYQRTVSADNGDQKTVQATVTKIVQIVRPDGTETDGYVVTCEYGGGA